MALRPERPDIIDRIRRLEEQVRRLRTAKQPAPAGGGAGAITWYDLIPYTAPLFQVQAVRKPRIGYRDGFAYLSGMMQTVASPRDGTVMLPAGYANLFQIPDAFPSQALLSSTGPGGFSGYCNVNCRFDDSYLVGGVYQPEGNVAARLQFATHSQGSPSDVLLMANRLISPQTQFGGGGNWTIPFDGICIRWDA